MKTAIKEPSQGFAVNAFANGVTMSLYGDVGFDVLASDVAEALKNASGKPVSVHIFSFGGSAGEGLAIYNILDSYQGEVTTVIDGIAASAGGLIFMAGKKRVMPANSLFHLHSVWGNASGNAERMRTAADQFDAHEAIYKNIYAQKSGQEEAVLQEWMDVGQGAGTWFNASEALAAGFATEVADALPARASVPLPEGRFAVLPEAALAWVGDSVRIHTNPDTGAMATSASAAEAATPEPQAPALALAVEPPAAAVQVQPEQGADAAAVKREVEIRRAAAYAKISPEEVDALVASGKPLNEVTIELIKAHAKATESPSPAGHPARMGVTRDQGDTLAQAFGDELARRAGLISAPTDIGKQVYGFSARELCRAWLDRNGVQTAGRSVNELISMAFHSTSDLTALFENTAQKALRAGHEEEPQTWTPLSSRSDLPDFKKATEVDFSARLIPQPIKEGGAYKTGVLNDGKGTWQLFSYGLEVGLTRQAVINDDLSALGEVPMMQGRGCRLLESNLIWALLTTGNLGATVTLDNKALFHADHNNTISGGTSVIGIPGMTAAELKLSTQTDASGNSLNLEPAFILAPRQLKTEVLQFLYPINYSPTVLTGANGSNPYAGAVQPIFENRLAEATNGTKMWYLAASPSRVPMLRHGYLQGEAGPVLIQEEKRNPDVISMLVRMDFGCSIRDWRGFVRSAGE
jgi:ATP-dependent protease ClpP protease subunit